MSPLNRTALILSFFGVIINFPSAIAQSNMTAQQENQQLFFNTINTINEEARKHTTRGTDVSSPAVCAQARPLWQQAYDLLEKSGLSGDIFNKMLSSTGLRLGRCLITDHEEAEAVRILERSIVGTRSDARIHLLLAELYAEGRGVKKDPVRALGHFMLGDDGKFDEYRGPEFSENIDLSRIRRCMAELLVENRDSADKYDDVVSPWMQKLLEQGEAKNWLRAVQLMTPNGNYYRSDLLRIQLRALNDDYTSDNEDKIALQTMRLNIGNTFLGFDSPNLAAALYFLQTSSLKEARDSLAKVGEMLPYRLLMPTGKTWSAVDAQ